MPSRMQTPTHIALLLLVLGTSVADGSGTIASVTSPVAPEPESAGAPKRLQPDKAMALVDRPPRVRRVRATCDFGSNAGWQQVKIRRRRSSGIGSGSVMIAAMSVTSAMESATRFSARALRMTPIARRLPATNS